MHRKIVRRLDALKRSFFSRVPRKLPSGLGRYNSVYSMLLKHCLKRGKLRGRLVEVGPFTGEFMNFLCTEPGFNSGGQLDILGLEPTERAVKLMPEAARKRTVCSTVEDFVERNPGQKSKADVVIAANVFNSPRVSKKSIPFVLHAISELTRKGGKVILKTDIKNNIPAPFHIKKEGFEVIDSLEQRTPSEFVLVLQKTT